MTELEKMRNKYECMVSKKAIMKLKNVVARRYGGDGEQIIKLDDIYCLLEEIESLYEIMGE